MGCRSSISCQGNLMAGCWEMGGAGVMRGHGYNAQVDMLPLKGNTGRPVWDYGTLKSEGGDCLRGAFIWVSRHGNRVLTYRNGALEHRDGDDIRESAEPVSVCPFYSAVQQIKKTGSYWTVSHSLCRLKQNRRETVTPQFKLIRRRKEIIATKFHRLPTVILCARFF